MLNIKGAIFDMDGTLLDSMQIWDTMGSRYLMKRGITPKNGLDYYFRTLSLREAAEYYRSEYGLSDTVEFIMDDVNKMTEQFYKYEALAKTGVKSVLEALHAMGVKMCVATATDEYLVKAALERCGLLSFFSKIFTCTDVGAGKNNPLIFEQSLHFLSTPKNETYVFEDSLFAIKTAKAAGFPIVAVADLSSADCAEEIHSLADIYIENFDTFRRMLHA